MTRHVDYIMLVKAFILGGNQGLWDKSINARFLWFMPTMLMVLLFRNIFFNCSNVVRLFIVAAAFLITVPFPNISSQLRFWTPLAVMNALFYVWPAILFRFIAKKRIR